MTSMHSRRRKVGIGSREEDLTGAAMTIRHVHVHGMQCSKFTSMISIHLQSCVPKIIKICEYL